MFCLDVQWLELHELEAKTIHALKHELLVCRSYPWHINSARRQSDCALSVRRDLPLNDFFFWADYKQKYSLPQASVATSTMFYGGDRQEVTIFGILIIMNMNGQQRTFKLSFVSTIIENNSLMSSLLFSQTVALFPQTLRCTKLHVMLCCYKKSVSINKKS